jgi:ABC-type Fe3+ transport system permease subunit
MDFSSIYGPLDKQACIYFSFMTVLFFVILVLTLITEIFFLIKNYKSFTRANIVSAILMIFNIFLAYFVNRLMYNMCNKSLA